MGKPQANEDMKKMMKRAITCRGKLYSAPSTPPLSQVELLFALCLGSFEEAA